MQDFLRVYLPVFYILVMIVAFVLPSYRIYKNTGINPVTFGKEANAHDYIGRVMKVLLASLFVVILVFSFGRFYKFMLPVFYLENVWLRLTGFVVAHLSLAWITVAQVQMSNSWRIGIDKKNKTELVTTGLFSLSRNPIFLGMIVCLAALFIVIPNAVSFCLFVCTYIVIQVQIRLEEEFLVKQHGEVYKAYLLKTPRLL